MERIFALCTGMGRKCIRPYITNRRSRVDSVPGAPKLWRRDGNNFTREPFINRLSHPYVVVLVRSLE